MQTENISESSLRASVSIWKCIGLCILPSCLWMWNEPKWVTFVLWQSRMPWKPSHGTRGCGEGAGNGMKNIVQPLPQHHLKPCEAALPIRLVLLTFFGLEAQHQHFCSHIGADRTCTIYFTIYASDLFSVKHLPMRNISFDHLCKALLNTSSSKRFYKMRGYNNK